MALTPRTHGSIQHIAETAPGEAAELRAESVELRAKADDCDRLAGVLEALYAVAAPHARTVDQDKRP